ncbi:lipopolysaccharide biosynthesis protein [Herbiconiux daphne]|uniref:lipopolysaccharide biosynthesis protein n=1 Tax=Herbiconiux daphne TaxID=2970914 RepID=UPI00217DECCF|nr:lipopolysaccharide biosynthesis protein [Herbiconiux daphne]
MENDVTPRSPRRYRVGGQFAWVSAGRIVAALIQALTMLLLVRTVAPAEFGFFSAVYGVVTVVQTAIDLGIPTYVIRERAKDASQPFVTSALRLSNLLSLLLAFLLLAAFVALGFTFDSRFFLLVPLAIWAAAERNADAWLGVVFADGDAKINTANLVGRRLGNLGLFVLLVLLTQIDPVLAFGISSASAAVVSWVFAHVYVARRLVPYEPVKAGYLIRESWPYWLNSVATQARNLDTALTSVLAGSTQAGFYAAASRLTSPLRILPTSLASVLLPASSKRDASNIRGLIKLVALAVAAFAVMYAVLIIVIPFGVPVLLGAEYEGAILALQITAVGLVFASSASLLGSLLQGVGMKHFVAMVAVVTTCTCLAGVALGALLWGATGAALGLAFSYVVQSAALSTRLTMFVVRKETNR